MTTIYAVWKTFVEPNHLDWTWELLDKLYGEPHRKYHNMWHVQDCLNILEAITDDSPPREAALALLWHDAVYVPGDKRNEELSAGLLRSMAPVLTVDVEVSCNAILATKNHETSLDNAVARLVIDVDMSILGTFPIEYGLYVRSIRKEYSSVSDEAWRVGRGGFLTHTLNSNRIFQTEPGYAFFEAKARENMRRELASLR